MAKGKFSIPRGDENMDSPDPAELNRDAIANTDPGAEALAHSLEELDALEDDDLLQQAAPSEPEAPSDSPEPESDEEEIEEAFRQITEEDRPNLKADFLPIAGDFWQENKKVILVSACALMLVIVVGILGFFLISSATDPYDGLILNNVTVAGVNIGGMTRSDAEEVITQVTDSLYGEQTMVLTLPGETISFSPEDSGIRVDVRGAVKAAYAYGRSGSKTQQENDYNNSLKGNHIIGLQPYLKVSEKQIRNRLETYAENHVSVFTPSSYALEGTMPQLGLDSFDETAPCQTLMLNLGTPGGTLDVDNVLEQLIQTYAQMKFSLEIEILSADSVPEPLDLDAIHEEVSIAPVDSSMDLLEFEVIPGSYGYTFNLEQARKQLSKAEYGDTVTIPMEYVAPEILEDDVLYQDVLGAFSTPHNDNANRNANLAQACKTLNGLILYPGDLFSYNDTLGKRTADKGYKPAPAYSGDTLVDSIGGGICQVSSTLYSATLLADMEIVDRINHGFAPTYMEKGLDATVNWGGPDFKFRNSSNFPIKILAETTEEEVKIQILGTDERDYYVKMEVEVVGTDQPSVKYDEYEPGGPYVDGQIISYGVPGYYVKSYKCKYDKETGKLLSREYEASSNYKMIPKQIAVVESPSQPEEEELQPETPPETHPTVPPETDPPQTTPPETNPPESNPPADLPSEGGSGGDSPAPDDNSGGDSPAPDDNADPPDSAPDGGSDQTPPADDASQDT